jgi:hypothetical protein
MLTIPQIVETSRHHPNIPLRQAGDIAIDDGSHDREPCKVGKPQPDKLIIEFKVQRDHPDRFGNTISMPNIKHRYPHEVDWKDKKIVADLTRWRSQIFLRALEKKRDGRQVWLESERDVLLEVLEVHLEEVGGRWSKINWEEVAKRFNRCMRDMTQRAGEMTVERRYDANSQCSKQQTTSRSQPLKEDRKAPERSSGSIHTQISYFIDPRAKEIISQAKAKNKKAMEITDSQDEEER